ncbi:hypothetical protein SAMN05216233_1125 [Desulfoluna spongiiphila]|uniref:Uncharacterized protein n=1 Tax=Desulfoluna spongiiphila TaxID=419481 RepID=A0A1G5GZ17_9BACT|nr:hypothetical protein SAMN05216233_1125 [Desulfoluna spongiiphila]
MNDAELDIRLRKGVPNGFRKALQTVNTGDQNIIYPSALKLSEDAKQKFCTPSLSNPEAKKLFVTL